MSGGQATLDALTFEEDEETRETPVGDEEEQAELSPPTDDDLREDATTDETAGATDAGEGEDRNENGADDSVRRPEDLRDDEGDSGFTSSRGTGGTTTCPSCGAESDKCYRCSECGKDLVGGG